MDQVGSAGFEMMSQSPLYADYAAVAPDVDAFPSLMDKTGALLRTPFDWHDQLADLQPTTMLVTADADSISPAYAADLYQVLGGGLVDAGWDGSGASRHRLAVLPGCTHYNVFTSPLLATVVDDFLT
jgi:hypothetical protein